MNQQANLSIYTAWGHQGFSTIGLCGFLDCVAQAQAGDQLVYYAPEEFSFGGDSDSQTTSLDTACGIFYSAKQRGVEVIMITGRHPESLKIHTNEQDMIYLIALEDLIDFRCWPDYFFFATGKFFLSAGTNSILSYHNQENPAARLAHKDPSMLFCSLNMNPHLHRAMLLDKLCEFDLMEHNVITWLRPGESRYNFEHWTECLLPDPDLYYGFQGFLDQYHTLMPQYQKTLFDIVAESSPDVIFWTEKTVRPIANFKPFVIVGAKHINKLLQELGFVLYDELFDYAFDELDQYSDRIQQLVEQISTLNTRLQPQDYPAIREQLSKKIQHNFANLLRLMSECHIPASDILSGKNLYDYHIDDNKRIIDENLFLKNFT